MNFNLPSTAGDWFVIVAAIIVTHFLFVAGAHFGWWNTDSQGHIIMFGKGS